YGGQWRSLAITVDKPLQSLEHAVEKFHEEHERAYAFSDPNKDVEIYGLRIEAIGVVPKPQFSKAEKRGTLEDALKGYSEVYFQEASGYTGKAIDDRDNLPVDAEMNGPANVEQLDAIDVIPPEFTAKVDEYKNIIISLTNRGDTDRKSV